MVVASLEKTEETRWLVKGENKLGNEYRIGQEISPKDRIRLEHCSTRRNLHNRDELFSKKAIVKF